MRNKRTSPSRRGLWQLLADETLRLRGLNVKIKIANMDYIYGGDGRLTRFSEREDKPWTAYVGAKVHKFRTHAQAIRWANKQVRKGKA